MQIAPGQFPIVKDVVIFYHLNSLLYADPALINGLRVRLDLFHESSLTQPVYNRTFEVDPLPTNVGGILNELR